MSVACGVEVHAMDAALGRSRGEAALARVELQALRSAAPDASGRRPGTSCPSPAPPGTSWPSEATSSPYLARQGEIGRSGRGGTARSPSRTGRTRARSASRTGPNRRGHLDVMTSGIVSALLSGRGRAAAHGSVGHGHGPRRPVSDEHHIVVTVDASAPVVRRSPPARGRRPAVPSRRAAGAVGGLERAAHGTGDHVVDPAPPCAVLAQAGEHADLGVG